MEIFVRNLRRDVVGHSAVAAPSTNVTFTPTDSGTYSVTATANYDTETPVETADTFDVQETGVTPPQLNLGSTGDDVAVIHAFLGINYGYYYYGPLAKDAVKAWQMNYNTNHPSATIGTDGIVGTQTWIAMGFVNPSGLLDRNSTLYQQNLNIAKNNDYNTIADKIRHDIIDLALKCCGNITYEHLSAVKLLNPDGSLKSGLQLDCSSFVSALYYTEYDEAGHLESWFNLVQRLDGGGADRESQMGTAVQSLKNSDGTINYNSLKPGDLLFFDYNLDGVDYSTDVPPGRAGIYEHVAVYIGDGQYVDTIPNGCSINSSANSSGANLNELNSNSWGYGAVHDMILVARRFIQNDGSIFVQ